MGERKKEFRQIIARIEKIQKMEEESTKQKDLSEIMPAICGVKKSIENYRNSRKEIVNKER